MTDESLPATIERMPISEMYISFKEGNPNKLNGETKRKFLTSIRKGNSLKIACGAAKIHYTTFKKWMKLGNEGIHPYFEFFLDVEEAQALIAEEMNEAMIQHGKKGNIGGLQWQLAKIYPEEYGNNKKIETKEEKKQEIIIKGLPSPNNPQLEKKENMTIEAKYTEYTEKPD